MKNTIVKAPPTALQSPLNTIEGLKLFVEAYKENHKVTQQERTKRQEIEARKEIALENIRAQRDILKLFLEESFKERGKTFDKLFEALDESLASGNHEALSMVLGSIIKVAETSPMAQAQKLIGDYDNPDVDEIII